MRAIIPILLATFLSVAASGQSHTEEITKTFEDYFLAFRSMDYEANFDYLYPELFNIYPRDILMKAAEETFSDTTLQLIIGENSIDKISKQLEIDGVRYALISYSYSMTMVFLEELNPDSDIDQSDLITSDVTYEILKGVYGKKNVRYFPDKSQIEISYQNKMYAINNPKYDGWKFLEKKKSLEPVLAQLLPKKVIKKL